MLKDGDPIEVVNSDYFAHMQAAAMHSMNGSDKQVARMNRRLNDLGYSLN